MSAPPAAATPPNANDARLFVPPATTRAGMAQRAIPTIGLTHTRELSGLNDAGLPAGRQARVPARECFGS